MRFEPRHAFLASRPVANPLRRPGARPARGRGLPIDVGFLLDYGVARDILVAASGQARREGVSAARALLAHGGVSATLYYHCLARRLGVPFVDDQPRLAAPLEAAAAIAHGRARLADGGRWLLAPADDALRLLLEAQARPAIHLPDVAITTPAHLAALVRRAAAPAIVHAASHRLPETAPRHSAKQAVNRRTKAVCAGAALACVAGIITETRAVVDLLGLLFFAAMTFRVLVCAAGLGRGAPARARIADAAAPFYSVLVALYNEPAMIPGLVAALRRLDYPRAKLEIMILIETDDAATRDALRAEHLPPFIRVVVVPDGQPRTKPRALNVGLMMARGALITVFDAEDRPDPDQLRKAAARFAGAPGRLACLQARLAIGNGADGLLPRLFAMEYAGLFDVLNIGIGRLGLPMALGGTSNHFRTSVLRDVLGWDAWNVTEDADLGLRLARFGYTMEGLDSTTWEAAPAHLPTWFHQRRRWTKGWMQTLLVLARDPRLIRDLGLARFAAVALMLTTLVTGPLLSPVAVAVIGWHLARHGVPHPRGATQAAEATLAVSVFWQGIASTLWCGYIGIRARGLERFLPSLPAFVPYQLLISAAAWGGAIDLFRNPHHWRKTDHTAVAGTRIWPMTDRAKASDHPVP